MAVPKKSTSQASKHRRQVSRARRRDDKLPASLREYTRELRSLISQLEKQLGKARAHVRRDAARLIRNATYRLGELEACGEAAWQRLTKPYREDAVRLLTRLERAVAATPAANTSRRPTLRKEPVSTQPQRKRTATPTPRRRTVAPRQA